MNLLLVIAVLRCRAKEGYNNTLTHLSIHKVMNLLLVIAVLRCRAKVGNSNTPTHLSIPVYEPTPSYCSPQV